MRARVMKEQDVSICVRCLFSQIYSTTALPLLTSTQTEDWFSPFCFGRNEGGRRQASIIQLEEEAESPSSGYLLRKKPNSRFVWFLPLFLIGFVFLFSILSQLFFWIWTDLSVCLICLVAEINGFWGRYWSHKSRKQVNDELNPHPIRVRTWATHILSKHYHSYF